MENVNKKEEFSDIVDKGQRLEALIKKLRDEILEQEKRTPFPFNDFLYLASQKPEFIFRDIFQLFHDMVHHYVPEGEDAYEGTPDFVGFFDYDFKDLFVNGCDSPFFADRLFSNRLMNVVKGFRSGTQNNNIFLFEGPPGSGKSTFLNNLLQKFEIYAKTDEGSTFKTYWRIDIKKFGGFKNVEKHLPEAVELAHKQEAEQQQHIQQHLHQQHSESLHPGQPKIIYPDRFLKFSCPNHDHPILMIPKQFRRDFLDELIPDENFKEKLFNEKQYEWVLKESPCSICSSIYKTLLDRVKDPLLIYDMIFVRKNFFNRQFGECISVFNPGDAGYNKPIVKQQLQNMINELFNKNNIEFTFSYLAKTNNGVLALMDIKEFNVERLKNYHGIISDGIHKIELTEERIRTLFLGLVNPEDKVHYEGIKSFQDRVMTVNVPYILDYNTEVSIYKNKFGIDIEELFLPGVLENFSKIIIATRLEKDSPAIRKWIEKPDKYRKFVDRDWLILKMEIYTGLIPNWLSEEDTKRFNKQVRKEILSASEKEGNKGFSGRQSLLVLNSFLSQYADKDYEEEQESPVLITMDNVKTFFTNNQQSPFKKIIDAEIPTGFIDSLIDMYDYDVLQQVKEAIYYYNEKQITADIKNYLYAINFDIGETRKSEYTGDVIEITVDYLKNFEAMFLGTTSTVGERLTFRNDIHSEYITKTLAQEIRLEDKKIEETNQFKLLFDKYTRNLKENALAPYLENVNFRKALQEFDKEQFNKYDQRIKRDINLLITNLKNKFHYSTEAAIQITLYVLDKNLAKKY